MRQAAERQKQRMIEDFEDAAALGHAISSMQTLRQSKTQTGTSILCSCGYSTPPKKRKVTALAIAYAHCLDALHGVIPPSSMIGEFDPDAVIDSLDSLP
jgi:hypothetical protein